MDQPNYMNQIEQIKSQSDLESLQKRIEFYKSKVNISDDPEYREIDQTLSNYLNQIKNGAKIQDEDIVSLQKRWNKFMVGHVYTGLWTSRTLGLIVAIIIITPLYYLITQTKPGYELIIVIPIIALLVYLVVRFNRAKKN